MLKPLEFGQAQLLSRAQVFSGLDRPSLAQLAGCVELLSFAGGSEVVRQGDPGDALYVVVAGSFDIVVSAGDKGETRLDTLGPGAVFGEMALLTGEPRSATVRASVEGAVLRLERQQFQDLVGREPEMATAIIGMLAQRLRTADRGWAERDRLLVTRIEGTLNRLPSERRDRVLEASLLDDPSPTALRAVFGAAAAEAGEDLAGVAQTEGIPPAAVLEVLRARLRQEIDHLKLTGMMLSASERLAAAGCWEQALGLTAQAGTPDQVVRLLGAALRSLPSVSPGVARHWASRTGDEEAAADPAVALARADLLETGSETGRALQLLQAALGRQMQLPGGGDTGELSQAISRLASASGDAAPVLHMRDDQEEAGRSRPALGAALAVTVAAALILAVLALQLPAEWEFVMLLGAAACFWIADLVPDYVVALSLVGLWVLSGIATPKEAMAGFASSAWVFVLAVLGIAAAVANSGLLFRIGLLLVRHMPAGLFGQAATLLYSGILLIPLLPQAKGRVVLTTPLALAIADSRGVSHREPAAAVLGLAAWIGAAPLMYLFLNGSTLTLLAWGLLPPETRDRFDWLSWFAAAAPLGIFVSLGSLAVLFLLLRPQRTGPPAQDRVSLQLAMLGPLTGREKGMVAILLATVAAWVVAPGFGVDVAVVGIAGLLASFVVGCFDTKALQSLDWSYLLFYGVALAIGQLAVSLGIDKAAADSLGDWLGPAATDPLAFVMAAALITFAVRLVLPQNSGVLLLVLTLVPLSWGAGVDPWIVVITVLATSAMWFLPQQTSSYLIAYYLSKGRLYSHRQARVVCVGFAVVTLIGLFLSVPYWHVLGLL